MVGFSIAANVEGLAVVTQLNLIKMNKEQLYKHHEDELRSVVQFAAPFACEGLAVEQLRKFGKELEQLLRQTDCYTTLLDDAAILKLIKEVKPEPLPNRWQEDEDMNPNYMGGFLTAIRWVMSRNGA